MLHNFGSQTASLTAHKDAALLWHTVKRKDARRVVKTGSGFLCNTEFPQRVCRAAWNHYSFPQTWMCCARQEASKRDNAVTNALIVFCFLVAWTLHAWYCPLWLHVHHSACIQQWISLHSSNAFMPVSCCYVLRPTVVE